MALRNLIILNIYKPLNENRLLPTQHLSVLTVDFNNLHTNWRYKAIDVIWEVLRKWFETDIQKQYIPWYTIVFKTTLKIEDKSIRTMIEK